MNATAIADLSWAERNWVTLYEGRNEIVVTGMVAFVMHEVVYFGRYLPFFICDFIPAFQKYKLQPVRILYLNLQNEKPACHHLFNDCLVHHPFRQFLTINLIFHRTRSM